MTTNAPVLTVTDDSPFVDRIADKVRTLAAVKPALVRLLEWQIDQELERGEGVPRLDALHQESNPDPFGR
jgi:hypothetical protein